MLEENVWMQLSEKEKITELKSYLDILINIDKGNHELYKTKEQGKLVSIKKDILDKINKIIEWENVV